MSSERGYAIGLFSTGEAARAAIEELRARGFAGGDVSVLMPTPEEREAAAGGTGAAPEQRVAASAALGGMIGAFAGWLVGLAALSVPGLGPLLAAGTFATAMAGAGVGVGIGAFVGALADMGVPPGEAEWFEREVRAGNTLVSVRAGERRAEALEVLNRHGAYDATTGALRPPPVAPPGPA
ncbi:MAG TPA: low temperature-induced protein [Chloroflexota bacterium]|jgi:hypothetical protein|nr:low temperature-induced protein [Chloroflexota bacterium]